MKKTQEKDVSKRNEPSTNAANGPRTFRIDRPRTATGFDDIWKRENLGGLRVATNNLDDGILCIQRQ
jgi:hypothetical protein